MSKRGKEKGQSCLRIFTWLMNESSISTGRGQPSDAPISKLQTRKLHKVSDFLAWEGEKTNVTIKSCVQDINKVSLILQN
jgi:hypothetical protein